MAVTTLLSTLTGNSRHYAVDRAMAASNPLSSDDFIDRFNDEDVDTGEKVLGLDRIGANDEGFEFNGHRGDIQPEGSYEMEFGSNYLEQPTDWALEGRPMTIGEAMRYNPYDESHFEQEARLDEIDAAAEAFDVYGYLDVMDDRMPTRRRASTIKLEDDSAGKHGRYKMYRIGGVSDNPEATGLTQTCVRSKGSPRHLKNRSPQPHAEAVGFEEPMVVEEAQAPALQLRSSLAILAMRLVGPAPGGN